MNDEFTRESLLFVAGPIRAEAALLDLVDRFRAKAPADLALPVRIIVPSRSLRHHLLRVLARMFGSLVGVTVQTHRAAALEVLERAGRNLPPGGVRCQDILAREMAAREPVLNQDLGIYDDGFAPVAAAVRDLLDAGFGPDHLDGVSDAIGEVLAGAEAARATAVIRVADACFREIERLGTVHRGTLPATAASIVTENGPRALPSRLIMIYGFAEATGLLTDFLEVLVRHCRARVVIDHPPDPAETDDRDRGWVFTRRLVDRLAGPGTGDGAPFSSIPEIFPVTAFSAPGPDAEVREIANRIRVLLDDGMIPEEIGVVFRTLDPAMAVAVRRHFRRLGIPMSGEGAEVPGGSVGRRAAALAEVLTDGIGVRTQSWLRAGNWSSEGRTRDLDLAMRTVGAARLDQVPALAHEQVIGEAGLRLPLVERVDEVDGDIKPRRRRYPRPDLEAAVAEASALIQILERRPVKATVGTHFAWIREVVAACSPQVGEVKEDPVRRAIDDLEAELPSSIEVNWRAVAPLVVRSLQHVGAKPLGGNGGGVQVLAVVEARARTFTHLFLAGLNRGVFPADLGDDPVLPPRARRALAPVLPDLPLKERDRPEERYLFAQLMASGRRVTVSWQRVDAEGKERNRSVFVERLCLGGRLACEETREVDADHDRSEIDAAPDVYGPRAPYHVRPVVEHAVVEGLKGRGSSFTTALELATGAPPGHALAVLAEQSPDRQRFDLGPFFGQIGGTVPVEVWVSRLESVLRCPWQSFLVRDLGLEPPPEAVFTETALAGPLVGSVVHGVLERISKRAGVESRSEVSDLHDRAPRRVAWPPTDKLEKLVGEVARAQALERGVPALAPAVARLALGPLDRARTLAWPDDTAEVLAVECVGKGVIDWRTNGDKAATTIRFRADRVDRETDGEGLILIDFKTALAGPARPETAIAQGGLLQGVAYVLGGGGGAIGRYLVLDKSAETSSRTVVDVDERLAAGAYGPIGSILGTWASGWFFPRLADADGGVGSGPCRSCPVKAACLYGDSGVRGRLVAAFDAMAPDDPRRRLWRIAKQKPTDWTNS